MRYIVNQVHYPYNVTLLVTTITPKYIVIMSEYQYYYFEAVDTPLTDKQQQELRKISTRADINSRRFANEYNYGDLKADPLNLMKKYFDIHLYYANWGTRIIMFKIPRDRIDFDLVKRYENCETLDISEIGKDLIIEITADTDDNDEWWEGRRRSKNTLRFAMTSWPVIIAVFTLHGWREVGTTTMMKMKNLNHRRYLPE